VEVAPGKRNVAENLHLEGIRRFEAALGSDPGEEPELDRGIGAEVEWPEVEQVGLDGVGVFTKSWAIACIGDGIEGFAAQAASDGYAADVDTVRGDKFFILSEIDGWDSAPGSDTAAFGTDRADREGSAEQAAGKRDVSRRDTAANLRA